MSEKRRNVVQLDEETKALNRNTRAHRENTAAIWDGMNVGRDPREFSGRNPPNREVSQQVKI